MFREKRSIGIVVFMLIYPLVAAYVDGQLMQIDYESFLNFQRFTQRSPAAAMWAGFAFRMMPGIIALFFLPLRPRLVWALALGVVYVFVMYPVSIAFGVMTGCYFEQCLRG